MATYKLLIEEDELNKTDLQVIAIHTSLELQAGPKVATILVFFLVGIFIKKLNCFSILSCLCLFRKR